MVFKITCYV